MGFMTSGELHTQAEDLARRTGDVLFREGSGPNLEFIYDPKLSAKLIRSARSLYPKYSGFYGEEITQPLDGYWVQTELEKPLHDSNSTHRLTQLGGAAAGYAGMEQITHWPLISLAGIALGGLTGYVRRRVSQDVQMRHRKESLSQKLDDIEAAFKGPEVVRLPRSGSPFWLDSERTKQLVHSEIPISGSDTVTAQAGDVLKWLRKSIAHDSPIIDVPGYYFHPRTYGDEPSLGPSIELKSSLWQIFKKVYEAKDPSGSMFGQNEEKMTETFVEIRDKLAESAQLQLLPTTPKFIGKEDTLPHHNSTWDYVRDKQRKAAQKIMELYGLGWKDVKCSYIYLPSGQVVERLLRTAKDPNSLWGYIAADAKQMSETFERIKDLEKQARTIEQRSLHAGFWTKEGRAENQQLNAQAALLRYTTFMSTLSIAARAMFSDRAQRYDDARQNILGKMSTTAEATGQFTAIQLFDKAIDALVANLEPDSEVAIQTSADLQEYLEGSMRYLDGSQETYDQMYAGMKLKFPQLKLA